MQLAEVQQQEAETNSQQLEELRDQLESLRIEVRFIIDDMQCYEHVLQVTVAHLYSSEALQAGSSGAAEDFLYLLMPTAQYGVAPVSQYSEHGCRCKKVRRQLLPCFELKNKEMRLTERWSVQRRHCGPCRYALPPFFS